MSVYFEWVMVALGVAVVAWLAGRVVRRARELDRCIDEFHREQEEAANSGAVIDPYAGLADVFSQEPKKDGTERRV